MVLQKRLDYYGFNGYQAPPIPRATRSARRRGVIRRKTEGDDTCPFDLLATVAGKLLGEGESSPDSSGSARGKDQCVISKDEKVQEKSYERGFFISELVSQAPVVNSCSSELPHAQNDTFSGPPSVTMSSDSSEKLLFPKKVVDGNFSSETTQEASDFGGVFSSCKLDAESDKQIKIELSNNTKVSTNKGATVCSSELPDDSVRLCLSTYPVIRKDEKLATRDNDENSGCTQPSTKNKASKPAPGVRDRPIKKLLASQYWQVNLKSDSAGHVNADRQTTHAYHDRNIGYKHQRSQRDFPFKKRKLFKCGSFSNSDEGTSIDGICSSQAKESALHGNASSNSDSHVKVRIKSFRVPELFVEIPENATVGSLKRTVMEAVTAILGGGLRIGVVFQGKKVRDDSKTLLQTGISHDHKLDALGFALEPNPVKVSPPLGPDCRSCVLPYDTHQPLTRCLSPATVVHSGIQQGRSDDHAGENFNNFVESDRDSAPSPPYAALENFSGNSRALVPVSAVNAEALAVVPLRKPKRPESTQRRIRRPFSVAEVEALVHAVEKLGTGRWRDVKLRAFDNAKHRTYVDLKDKWKTLVHTARIAPQQRRGEPVPQELLDRVLTAHAYWSQQQAKHQMKQPSDTFLLL